MAMQRITRAPRLTGLVFVLACGTGGSDRGEGGETDMADTGTSGSTTTTTTATSATATTLTTDPTNDPDTGSTGDDPFVFEVGDPALYDQIDRKGMPAIATVIITSKDDYNHASPEDDADGDFVDEITANLGELRDALEDDLMSQGLTPCAIDVCVSQASPLVVPDVLRVDFTADNGFPNGRELTDPVIDITLAVLLLDLGMHDVTTFVDLPLNPTDADIPPLSDFPYLAEPH